MAESLARGAALPSSADERDARASLATDALARGTRLGRYELLVPIAVGGMARVWAARLHGQRGFTKLVAIKTILPHLASDPEIERMLVDEARIASGTRHPNVAEIYELGDERGVLYLAMEWVAGDSLAQILKGSGIAVPLDPRLAARIVADAAAGLHAAHNLVDDEGRALEVVHRDVSPHNLLVSIDGNVKVTDFGVAKAIGASHEATSAGTIKGKIAYMAPEQALGVAIDRRSDVFALGSVLYEVTTGKQPFRGEGEHQIMQELIKGSFAPPSRVVRGYPYELERIVLRALAAQPIHRYQAMDQMRLALEEWLARGTIVTEADVAVVVRERVGAEVERRRERIRLATTALAERGEGSDLSPLTPSKGSVRPPPAGTQSGVKPTSGQGIDGGRQSYTAVAAAPLVPAASALPPVGIAARRVPSGVQYVAAGSLGVLAAAALGAAGFWVWRSIQPAAPPASVVVVTPVETEPAILPPTPPATGTATAMARALVLFKIIPDKAILVVDGNVLPATTRTIARPLAGATESVTVRADGYDAQTLTIDDTAPAFIDVWLNEAAARKSNGRAAEGAPRRPEAKAPEALPANPY